LQEEVIIIAGANGSGKTTFAKSCEKKYPFEFVNADEIALGIGPKDISHSKIEDVVRRFYRSKKNFWSLYKELADKWHLIYNSEQQFIEFAFGRKGIYTINDEKLFESFIRDIKEETNHAGR